jgi:hypothetical protein
MLLTFSLSLSLSVQSLLLPLLARLAPAAAGMRYRDFRKEKNELLLVHAGQLLYQRKAAVGTLGTALHTHIHTHTYTHTHIHTHTHTRAYVCTLVYVYVFMRPRTSLSLCACLRVPTCVC